MNDEPLWTIDDVAAYLNVAKVTLYQWKHRGEGPPVLRINGRRLRYKPSEVRRWAEKSLAGDTV